MNPLWINRTKHLLINMNCNTFVRPLNSWKFTYYDMLTQSISIHCEKPWFLLKDDWHDSVGGFLSSFIDPSVYRPDCPLPTTYLCIDTIVFKMISLNDLTVYIDCLLLTWLSCSCIGLILFNNLNVRCPDRLNVYRPYCPSEFLTAIIGHFPTMNRAIKPPESIFIYRPTPLHIFTMHATHLSPFVLCCPYHYIVAPEKALHVCYGHKPLVGVVYYLWRIS